MNRTQYNEFVNITTKLNHLINKLKELEKQKDKLIEFAALNKDKLDNAKEHTMFNLKLEDNINNYSITVNEIENLKIELNKLQA